MNGSKKIPVTDLSCIKSVTIRKERMIICDICNEQSDTYVDIEIDTNNELHQIYLDKKCILKILNEMETMNQVLQPEFKPLPEIQELFQDQDQKTNLVAMARTLKLKAEYLKGLKDQVKELQAEYDVEEEQLYELMLSSGISKLGLEDKTLYPALQYWASVPEDMAEISFVQLENMGLGSLIKRTVNGQTLSAEVRRWIEEGLIVQEGEGEDNKWVFAEGPNRGISAAIKISAKKKIGIRK